MCKLDVTTEDFQMLENNDMTIQNILFITNICNDVHALCTRMRTVGWLFDSHLTSI
jgi:hypothetical protein